MAAQAAIHASRCRLYTEASWMPFAGMTLVATPVAHRAQCPPHT
jgi:hypothetical protein